MDDSSNSKTIYIVRHGETDFNKQGLVQGRGINASLNDLGRQQAAAFYNFYKDIHFDKVYVSSLNRTKESVMSFIDKDIPYEALSGLDEISWGSQEGVKFSEESKDFYFDTIKEWKNGNLDANVAGGESPKMVASRQKEAMEHILKQEEEKQILICMHGRAMRILMCWLLKYDLKQMDEFPHSNLGLYQLFFSGTMFRLDRINSTTHLKDVI